ncbi:mechanosensitive ion channel family protein [candidate division KSB1 bacterium]|nr:mechanosensitive ion channel family protein [candidate division KSB1 bacterium]
MHLENYITIIGEWFISSGLQIIIVVILTMLGLKVVRMISGKLFYAFGKQKEDIEFRKRADTLKSVVQYLLTITILVTAVIIILGELGVEIGPILAAAGVVGLAIGFGAQNLVQDVISGFFILLEDQIRVGDVVQIAGVDGLVEKINLRMVILRDLAGNVHYVRNGKIDIVTNMTKEYSRYVFDIGVAYREDVDEVIEVIKQVDESLRDDPVFGKHIIAPMEILGLDQFADSAIIIKTRTTTKPIKQWDVAREFNRRLKKAFEEHDIEIPFPHVTLYMGQGKQHEAAPLNVNLNAKQ